MKVSELNKIFEETISKEITNTILKEESGKNTAYCVKSEGEYVEVCDTNEEADQKCKEYNKNNPDKDFVVEIETYESKEDLLDKLDQLGEELDSKDMKEKHSIEELEKDQHESAFVLAADAAKDKGEKEFEFPKGSGEIHPVTIKSDIDEDEVCEECGDTMDEDEEGGVYQDIDESTCESCGESLCECSGMDEESINETKDPKVLRLSESQLIDMISKLVNEAISTPGLKAVADSHKGTNKETKEHMANVDKKLKKALSIEGNDNPEFPNASGKGEIDPKKVVHNTEEENEEVDMDRGEHVLDLDYDHEPTDQFKDRVKKALEGDSTMGNADGGNTIQTETGKNLSKTAEKRKKRNENMPMYKKDVQPVKSVNEEKESKEKSNVLLEEIKRLKDLSNYNEKTQ
tara:strand:+ start:6466 stop:7674 length:1209 start_codon:yes stop_codon:yes gene_type:complete